jgi:hypothetical protein
VATSIDRDLNGCGYCSYTTDSPATDASYTPNPATPRWDYRVVYELWIDADAFGAAGFGEASVPYVHASPSKASTDTINVQKGGCPPAWPPGYCSPNLVSEGLNCGQPPPGADGGTPSDGGVPQDAACGPGTIEYLLSEGRTCVPIPTPGPDGGLVCPDGYHVDLTSEGRYCLPN